MSSLVSLVSREGGLATFEELLLSGASLLLGFITSHKVLTLPSGGRYFWKCMVVVQIQAGY